MKSINQIHIQDKTILIRVDYNVPIKNGFISNTFRIDSSLKTIEYCLNRNCKIVLMSHLGRPDSRSEKYSLRPIFEYLNELFENKVFFTDDCVSDEAISRSHSLQNGEIHLLENLRFHSEELICDRDFSRKLSKHGDIFINDAFGTAHRSHSSNVGVSEFFDKKACGFLVSKEIRYLDNIIENKSGSLALLLGGSKVSDKIKLISRFEEKADKIIIGGAMSNTFLCAQEVNVGKSLIEQDCISIAKDILNKSKDKIVLPTDFICAKSISDHKDSKICSFDSILHDEMTADIGPETISTFKHIIKGVDNIIWNGPMGIIEEERFSSGTLEIVDLIKSMTSDGLVSVIGGGDTSSVIKYDDIDKFTHISTGGGASLKLLGGEEMPAFKSLNE